MKQNKFARSKYIFYGSSEEAAARKATYAKPYTVPKVKQTSEESKNVYVRYNGINVLCEGVDAGVEVYDIQTGLAKYPELKKSCVPKRDLYMSEYIAKEKSQSGCLIYVGDNASLNSANEVIKIYLYTSITEENIQDFSYNIISIGKGNSVEIISELMPQNSVTAASRTLYADIILKEGSACEYTDLLSSNDGLDIIETKNFCIAKNASVNCIEITAGGKTVNKRIDTFLEGEGAFSSVRGIRYGNKSQIYETYNTIHNIAPHTEGKVLYQNALTDKSVGLLDGLIKIEKTGQQTNSYLEDHTIILSPHAHAESIPCLEIEANDVKASHGTTVGALKEEELFYMQSRGISKERAVRIMVMGFFMPVIAGIKDPIIQKRIMHLLENLSKEVQYDA